MNRHHFTSPPAAAQRFDIATPRAAAASIATLTGYAIVWNVLSSDRGGYKVRLLPGSATFTTPALALYSHNYSMVIGNTANRTLRTTSDGYGVRVEIDLPDTTLGRDLVALVGRGDVAGMSFNMSGGPVSNREIVEAGQTISEVSSFFCDEVTITAVPAFASTTIAVKSGDGYARRRAPASLQLQRERLRMHRLLPI